jgi:6-phosphogluconolactonase
MLARLLFASCTVLAPLFAQDAGAVFTLTNRTTGNEVAVALRHPDGLLTPIGAFDTGGDGTGGSLGSQAALAMTHNGQWLIAVNAGSDDVTLFRRMFGVFLLQRDIEPSGGDMPVSVAVHGNLVYVLNAGAPNNVRGFRLHNGELQPLSGGTYALSGADTQPAQVGFAPSGDYLVVTEKATNKIDVFPVHPNGTLGSISVHDSHGMTPFGFEFTDSNTLVVSEAFGGAVNASAVSSYQFSSGGALTVVSGSVPTHQTAACWIATTPQGDFTYTTNTGSGSISGYAVGTTGTLTELTGNGQTGVLAKGSSPIDAAFDKKGNVLFVLDSGRDEVVAFHRDAAGQLHALPVAWPLPDGAAGLVVR